MITRSVYHSNAIEGNTLSYYETYQVIFNCGSDEELRAVKPRDLAEFHIRYERIHPFGDGNGRTGRVLLCKYCLANGYPPFVVPKEERNQYMNLLADCNIEGMKSFFEKLMSAERERMKQFQIDTSKLE